MYLTRHAFHVASTIDNVACLSCPLFFSVCVCRRVACEWTNGWASALSLKYTHKKPSNWNVDKLFHILYVGFLVIRLFGILFARLSFAFVAQIFYWFSAVNLVLLMFPLLWLCLLLLLLLLFCVITLLNKPVAMNSPLWACFIRILFVLMPFVVYVKEFFLRFIFMLASLDFRCAQRTDWTKQISESWSKKKEKRIVKSAREREWIGKKCDMLTYRYTQFGGGVTINDLLFADNEIIYFASVCFCFDFSLAPFHFHHQNK